MQRGRGVLGVGGSCLDDLAEDVGAQGFSNAAAIATAGFVIMWRNRSLVLFALYLLQDLAEDLAVRHLVALL